MAGGHPIELRLTGHKVWRSHLEVRANQPRILESVVLEIADATVRLISEPPGAEVLVGESYQGRTPLTLETRARCQPRNSRLQGRLSPADKTHPIDLGRKRGTYSPTGRENRGSPDRSATRRCTGVRRRNRPRGRQPDAALSARSHALAIRMDGYEPFQTRVRPEPGFPLILSVALVEVGAQPEVTAIGTTTPQGQELILVTPGRLTMGSSRREQGRRANEVLRTVELTRPFLISAREVSNQDFDAFDSSHTSGVIDGENLDAATLPGSQYHLGAGGCLLQLAE